MRKFACRLLSVALVMVFIGGCAAPPQAAVPTPVPKAGVATPAPSPVPARLEKVKLMISSLSILTSNVYVARDKGFYKQEGLDVEIVPMKSTLVPAALAAGEVDYSMIEASLLYAGIQGLPVKMLMSTITKPLWFLVGGKGVDSLADLKGKTVGVNTIGGSNHTTVKKVLAANGVDPDKDVSFVAIPEHAQLLAALKAGSLGAISTTSPFNVLATQAGFKQLVFLGDFATLSIAGLSTSDKKIKENRGQVKRAVSGTLKAMAFMRDNPKETTEYLMKLLEVEEAVAKGSLADLLKAFNYDGRVSDELLNELLESGRARGAIPAGKIDVDKGVDRTIVEEVKKELKL